MEQMSAAMADVDLFLGASPILTNRLGYPILTVPSGFFEGSPTGLHLTGKLFGEPELFLLGHALQSRTDHHVKHPPLP
jgi:Asp-tRNA(Asn)/Glu-tRNA(Gln) amidotransferase A subunit family amidase